MSGHPPLSEWKHPTARNLKTQSKFRRETWWQIVFPMLVVVLLMVACAAGIFVAQGPVGLSVVADYSLILLIIPMLLAGLFALAAVVGLIYLTGLGIDKLPPYAYLAHRSASAVQSRVQGVANAITGFVIAARAFIDGIVRFVHERLQAPAGTQTGGEAPAKGGES